MQTSTITSFHNSEFRSTQASSAAPTDTQIIRANTETTKISAADSRYLNPNKWFAEFKKQDPELSPEVITKIFDRFNYDNFPIYPLNNSDIFLDHLKQLLVIPTRTQRFSDPESKTYAEICDEVKNISKTNQLNIVYQSQPMDFGDSNAIAILINDNPDKNKQNTDCIAALYESEIPLSDALVDGEIEPNLAFNDNLIEVLRNTIRDILVFETGLNPYNNTDLEQNLRTNRKLLEKAFQYFNDGRGHEFIIALALLVRKILDKETDFDESVKKELFERFTKKIFTYTQKLPINFADGISSAKISALAREALAKRMQQEHDRNDNIATAFQRAGKGTRIMLINPNQVSSNGSNLINLLEKNGVAVLMLGA